LAHNDSITGIGIKLGNVVTFGIWRLHDWRLLTFPGAQQIMLGLGPLIAV